MNEALLSYLRTHLPEHRLKIGDPADEWEVSLEVGTGEPPKPGSEEDKG